MAATVPSLSQVFEKIAERIAADYTVSTAEIPVLSQFDPDYIAKYEAALRPVAEEVPDDGPGLVFVLWATGGDPAGGNDTQLLDLNNGVVIAVVESQRHNSTGKGALEWALHLLKLLHNADGTPARGRPALRHPAKGPAYELGGLGEGLVLYFVNLEIRTTESVGVPAAP